MKQETNVLETNQSAAQLPAANPMRAVWAGLILLTAGLLLALVDYTAAGLVAYILLGAGAYLLLQRGPKHSSPSSSPPV